MQNQIYKSKIERLRKGQSPRVLDLFSGCGGISLGFTAAGFSIAGAMDLDPMAAISHALNFHHEEFEKHSRAWDLTTTEPEEFASEIGLNDTENSIDVIVGGPPCQAFARVGRAKLREVDAHPNAFVRDPRGNLYLRYLHYVRAFKPIALLMENVPDVINYGGHNIPEEVCEVLDDLGYESRYTLLNAVHYGVPQMRERMFLVAFAKELKPKSFFPVPQRFHLLPKGYEGTRRVALKHLVPISKTLFSEDSNSYFVCLDHLNSKLPKAVTAQEALDDLPRITSHLDGTLKRGARRFDVVLPYPMKRDISEYARLMRNWDGFSNSVGVSDHVIRYLPRDYDIFEKMSPGDQYPEAHAIAMSLLHEYIIKAEQSGSRLSKQQIVKLQSEIVPPYDPDKFPNKWRKMEPDQPARTLMAHLGKDSYSHIHYDSKQKRTISVREAARLQSFPDGFVFHGTMNPAFRQIGNAVPPLLARAIAQTMMQVIKGIENEICNKEADSIRSDLFHMALQE